MWYHKLKNMTTNENERRLEEIRLRLKKNNVVDISFSGASDKELEYMDNALDILEENQEWIDDNARKKAAAYE